MLEVQIITPAAVEISFSLILLFATLATVFRRFHVEPYETTSVPRSEERG